MADSTIYAGQALLFDSTDVPFVEGSLSFDGGLNAEAIGSGNSLTPDLRVIVGKRPFIKATMLDPSQLTAAQTVPTDQASVKAVFRAYAENGGPGATYKSVTGSLGLLLPVSLSFAAQSRATLDMLFLAAFTTGTALTHGTASDAAATVAKAYYPTSLVSGGDTITDIQSGSVSWQYDVTDDNSQEPGYYVYRKTVRSCTFVSKDLSLASAARVEDGVVESVVLTLTNREAGGGTVSVNLGDCLVRASVSGDEVTLTCEEVTG